MQKIAVIGSGLNGLAVAFGLAVRGISVKIFEEKTFGGNFKEDLRTSFISHKTLSFLKHFEAEIREKSGIIQEIYSFKSQERPIVELASQEIGLVVNNSLLKTVLIEWLEKNVEISQNHKIENIQNTRHGVEINGEKFACAICASGANSSIHKSLGIAQKVVDYHQIAFTFDVKHQKPHTNIALEIFDETGIIALLPKKDEHTSSVILSIKNEIAQQIDENSALPFLKAKTERARNVGEILEISTPICQYPLATKYMKRQSFENIFFVGDAFHSVHPVLGQGFNMSAKDVILLCNEIEKAQKRGIPFERVTRNLPRKNIINHFKIGFATHFFGKAFLVENKIMEKITSGSILLGSVVPSGLKTKILSKLL